MGRLTALLMAALCAGLIPACGGGGGGDAGTLSSVAQTASIRVMLASERFDSVEGVFVTYTKVSLVPADGGANVVLFEDTDGEEVNVSRLDEEALLFAVMDDVPTGTYSKLLVEVDDIRVEGGPCEDLTTSIPDDELELVPEEDIEVNPGETIIIRLAMDADKSVQITVDGATDTCTFRPVVAVDVSKSAAPGEDSCPTTVEGEIIELMLNIQFDVVGAVIDLGDTRGEQDLLFDDATAFFGADGYPTDSRSIDLGDMITAKGMLDADGALETRVVVQGKTAVVTGTVLTDVKRGIFWIEPDEGSAVVGETPIEIFEGTQVLLDCVEATSKSIVKGARVSVSGKLAVGERSMRAVSVLVSPTTLVGDLIVVADAVGGGWDIQMIPTGTQSIRKVFVPESVGFYLEGDGPVPADLLADLVDCEERDVRIVLDEDARAPTAEEVRVDSEDVRGTVEDIAPDRGLIEIGDSLVAVERGATILDLRKGQKLIELGDIEIGSVVRAFGLEACDGDDVDFHAFVLLVLPEEDRPLPPPDRGYYACHDNKWKKNLSDWPARYGPSTLFSDVFDDVFPGKTLYQVINTKGGELNHLGRETVSALLNAASEGYGFPLTVDQVVREFNGVDHRDEKGEVKDLRKELHDLNSKGECPFDDKDDDKRDDDKR